MSTGCRNDDGSFCVFLSVNVGEIDSKTYFPVRVVWSGFRKRSFIRGDNLGFCEYVHRFLEIPEGDDVDIRNHACFSDVFFREKNVFFSYVSRENRRRKNSLHSSYVSVEC